MGNLYIVATPIGNLQDISFRALKTLKEVDIIACEDTRKTSILINHFFEDDKKLILSKLFSYYEQTEAIKIPQIIDLLKNDKNVALVSDAGTPTISDPGFKLIRNCVDLNIKVISIPGASSVTSALVSSGLPTDKFTFLGFLPKKSGHRITLLKNVKGSLQILSSTVIFYESPHKIMSTLLDLQSVFGDIQIVVARELTKIHESVLKMNVSEFIKLYKKTSPKGEITVLFNLKN